MDVCTVRGVIEIVAVLTMPAALIGFFLNRKAQIGRPQNGGKGGIGARSIQFIAVGMLFPVILILGLERIIDTQTIGTLIGAVVGYLLSGIGNYDISRMVGPARKAADPTAPPTLPVN